MNHVRFRITAADGTVTVGPVHGSGGLICAGTSHLTFGEREQHALRRLKRQAELAEEGRELGIYEPEPGCCAMKPEFSAESDGPVVPVPLKGATIELDPIHETDCPITGDHTCCVCGAVDHKTGDHRVNGPTPGYDHACGYHD